MHTGRQSMNRHENRYKRSRNLLLVACAFWIGMLALLVLLPRRVQNSEVTFVLFAVVAIALFVAIGILSVVNMVAYIRWTGKYPYYFLAKWLRRRGDTE